MTTTPFDTCSWYALCDHPGELWVEHPVLGQVPTCLSCADKHDLHARAVPACPTCGSATRYEATFGAPGVGQSWSCAAGHNLVKIGATMLDADDVPDDEEPPWVLTLGDVR